MLFVENRSLTLSIEEQKKHVLELVNKIRTQYGLKVFTLNKGLTKAAERMVSEAVQGRSVMPIFPENKKYETFTYETKDLTLLPGPLSRIVRKTHLRRIDIGLVYKKNSGSQKGTFFISFIFD